MGFSQILRLIYTIVTLTSVWSYAQAPLVPSNQTEATEAQPEDPYGRSTPRGTVLGLLRAVQREEQERAVNYLDTKLSLARAQELAAQLKYVLDRRFFVPLNSISDQREGSKLDEGQPNVERIGSVEGPKGQVPIILHRVRRDGQQVWLFAPVTLAAIPAVYGDIDTNWLEQNMPEPLRTTKIIGTPLWRWITFLINLFLAVLAGTVISRIATGILERALKRWAPQAADHHLFQLSGPARLICIALSFLVVARFASTVVGRNFWMNMAGIVSVIGLTWLAARLVDGFFQLAEERQLSVLTSSDLAVRRMMQRLTKVFIVLVGTAGLIRAFGKDPTTLLAGLGVGGIALAFAAQKTLENFFGGVMIITDRPIRVGDFCAVGNVIGTVEDIGLRSTRIRSLGRTVVSIPNGALSTQNVENFAVRDKFLMKHVLNLRYETTAEQMRTVLQRITDYLVEHPDIETQGARARFVAFGASSMDIEIFAYAFAKDWAEFLMKQEQILLRILEMVPECGTGFAFPSMTVYATKDTPPGFAPAGQAVNGES